MRLLLTILIFFIIGTACNNSLEQEFPDTSELIVVEGHINNQSGPHTVRLSVSNDYLSPELPTPIIDANVIVLDNAGNNFEFKHSSNGLYLSDSSLIGIVNRTYTLQVQLPTGDTLVSTPTQLNAVHEIDLLTYDFYIGTVENIEGEVLIYYPVIFANDPINTRNFYRWRVYRNDTLFSEPEDIVLLDDQFFSGEYKNEFTSFRFFENDKMKLEVSSLDKESYEYLQLFRNLTTSLGTANGIAPTSLGSNIVNISSENEKVLGYFFVSASNSAEITINP